MLLYNTISVLSGRKADGLANGTEVQMDASAGRLADCMCTVGALLTLDTKADGLVDMAE